MLSCGLGESRRCLRVARCCFFSSSLSLLTGSDPFQLGLPSAISLMPRLADASPVSEVAAEEGTRQGRASFERRAIRSFRPRFRPPLPPPPSWVSCICVRTTPLLKGGGTERRRSSTDGGTAKSDEGWRLEGHARPCIVHVYMYVDMHELFSASRTLSFYVSLTYVSVLLQGCLGTYKERGVLQREGPHTQLERRVYSSRVLCCPNA